MRTRLLGAVGLVAAVGLIGGINATAAPFPLVNGGGQTLADDQSTGPGDTIAFTAKGIGEDGAAQGQVQYVDREADAAQQVQHGTVSCLVVTGNTARLAGTWSDGSDFEIFVEDNGSNAETADQVAVYDVDTQNCEDDDEETDDPTALARGNVTIH